jgi:hypothetical protein
MLKNGDEELFVELKQARVLLGELPHAIDKLVRTHTSAISTITTQLRRFAKGGAGRHLQENGCALRVLVVLVSVAAAGGEFVPCREEEETHEVRRPLQGRHGTVEEERVVEYRN